MGLMTQSVIFLSSNAQWVNFLIKREIFDLIFAYDSEVLKNIDEIENLHSRIQNIVISLNTRDS